MRVDKIESDVLSELGRSIESAGRWERRGASEEQAARDAAKLLNEYGKDAYWLACLGERRSSGERARHWHAVAAEIEQRTGRRSPATPGKITGSLRAALNQLYVPPDADLPRLDAYHAGTRDDPYDEHSHLGDRHGSQVAAREFDRHQEDHAESGSAAWGTHDRADDFDRGPAMHPYNEEMYDDPPRKERRRGLITALALTGCVMVGTAGVYAYWTHYVAPGSTRTSAAPSQAEPARPALRGYLVQVSARRSKADAEASFRSLQSKFPRQLGGRTATIERADLGAKGIHYRAMVGPFGSAGAADQFCTSLRAAGGQCLLQRN